MSSLKQKGKSGSSVRLTFIHKSHFGFYRQKKIPPDMKRISSMPTKIKYFIVLLSCFFIVNKTTAQSNNIYLDGDNYITLNNPVFSSRLDWKELQTKRITMNSGSFLSKLIGSAITGKSYIVINLTSR